MASPPASLAVLYASGPRPDQLAGRRTSMRLAGKVALVTGAQQGIGRAIAVALAREGADVGLNYLDDPGAAEAVAEDVRALGRRAVVVRGDVARSGDVQTLVATVGRDLGVPEVLVNN